MKYIVAVSGGVDSVVLLDMLAKHYFKQLSNETEFVVAHVDHGMRPDSQFDAEFVCDLAKSYKLPFETIRLELGVNASEQSAREERYRWLKAMQDKHRAMAVVTAHHQDDVLETIILNLKRGTGWRGLSSLRSHSKLRRPLLTMSKAEIIEYALSRGLAWHDDSTNEDMRYLRNRIRHTLIPYLTTAQRAKLLHLYSKQCKLLTRIEHLTLQFTNTAYNHNGLLRYMLIMIDEGVLREVIYVWLGQHVTRPTVSNIRHFVCTALPGKRLPLDSTLQLHVTRRELIVSRTSI